MNVFWLMGICKHSNDSQMKHNNFMFIKKGVMDLKEVKKHSFMKLFSIINFMPWMYAILFYLLLFLLFNFINKLKCT